MASKLPVWSTVVASVRSAAAFTSHHPIFFVTLWVLQFPVDDLQPAGTPVGAFSPTAVVWVSVLDLVKTILGTPIILAIYRSILTDDRSAAYDIFSRRGRRFLAANLIFEICLVTVPSSVLAGIDVHAGAGIERAVGVMIAALLLIPTTLYWATRAYLLFPLIAIDQPTPISRSLVLTRGRVWRFLLITMFPAIGPGLAAFLLTGPYALPGADRFPHLLIDCFVSGVKAFAEFWFICGIGLVYLWVSGSDERPAVAA